MRRAHRFLTGAVLAGATAASAFSQPPPGPQQAPDSVVVEARSEALKRREEAQRSAAEARRLFAQTGKAGANLPAACRAAERADSDYQIAIKAAQDQRNVTLASGQARVEAAIKGLMEARDRLDETHDRLCNRAPNATPPAMRTRPRLATRP